MRQLFLTLSLKISQFATTRNILILLTCWIGFQVILAKSSDFIKAESQGTNVLDLAIGFSADEAYTNYMDKYSEAARAAYLKAACVDLVYPICYGLLFSCLISIGFKQTKFYYLNLLPVFAVFFDYLENIGIFSMLLSYPEKLIFMASWTSVFGGIKWLFAGLSILGMVTSLGKKAIEKGLR